MAAHERLNPRQFPGTEKNPQGRLFAPLAMRNDPDEMSPERWASNPNIGQVAYHASAADALPLHDNPYLKQQFIEENASEADYEGAYDDPENQEVTGYRWNDFGGRVDAKDRPMANYGSSIGIHLGSLEAAQSRAMQSGRYGDSRDYIHPARIPATTMREAGSTRWTDAAANYDPEATDVVEAGGVVPYKNEVESRGSMSFRIKPEHLSSWAEDVLHADQFRTLPGAPGVRVGRPRPEYVELAKRGYNAQVLNDNSDDDDGGIKVRPNARRRSIDRSDIGEDDEY